MRLFWMDIGMEMVDIMVAMLLRISEGFPTQETFLMRLQWGNDNLLITLHFGWSNYFCLIIYKQNVHGFLALCSLVVPFPSSMAILFDAKISCWIVYHPTSSLTTEHLSIEPTIFQSQSFSKLCNLHRYGTPTICTSFFAKPIVFDVCLHVFWRLGPRYSIIHYTTFVFT
jgi:hypothetical protein